MRIIIILGLIIYILSQEFTCNHNSKPIYGEETGLPKIAEQLFKLISME